MLFANPSNKTRWVKPALAASLLAIPPLEHSQRAERVPTAGRPHSLHFEVSLALVAVLQRPAAIFEPRVANDFDSIGKARIAGAVHGLEIIERPQNIVMPARRKG